MSGGVDSSVAAALMLHEGCEVVGATMKLWGGHSDSGCCSVADVEDARRVCQQLGIPHYVFNFTAEFERDVVAPYVAAHARARTPNPCIACNAHLKFDRFLQRASSLGFDAVVTGHHARVTLSAGTWQLRRGRDAAKDQSYVLYMLGQDALGPVAPANRGADQVRGAGAGGQGRFADGRPSPTARTSASSPKPGAGSASSASASRSATGRLVTAAGEDLARSTPWN